MPPKRASIYTIKGYIQKANKVMSQKNVWWVDLIKATVLVLLLSVVALSVSSVASTGGNEDESPIKSFNAIGTVSQITPTMLTLTEARSTVSELGDSFDLNLTSVQKTEDKDHNQVLLTSILPGSKIIVQGVKNYETINIYRVILLSMGTPAPESNVISEISPEAGAMVSTSTATSSEEVATTTSMSSTTEPIVETEPAAEPSPNPMVEPNPVQEPVPVQESAN